MSTDTTTDAPTEPTFSARIRDATLTAHRDAERSAFVHRLFRGQLSVRAVADLMAQHLVIYAALEDNAGVLAEDPVAGPFLDRRLDRVPRITQDLSVLLGADWAQQVRTLPEAEAYADDIGATVGRPERFLAHHYTRLLGDLSGGTIVRRALEKHLGSDLTGALTFYDFDDLGGLDAYKERYRRGLDRLPVGPAGRAAMIDEVNRAYRHNQAVFAALDQAHPAP